MSVLALLDFRRPTRGVDHAQFLDLVDGDLRRISRRFGPEGIIRSRQITDLDICREIIHRVLINSSTPMKASHIISDNKLLPHARTGVPERLIEI